MTFPMKLDALFIRNNKKKKILLASIILILAIVYSVPTSAEVNISIGISLPPPIVFEAPLEVVVIPDAGDVYVVPDIDVDIFFWNGWWWRPWQGRWYRSHYYNQSWVYYGSVPSFYFDIDPNWRGYYRDRNWQGHRWNYERIPHKRLQKNWKSWHNDRYWEKKRSWGVQSYQPPSQHQRQELRHRRQEQYHQMPDVQRHQQQRQLEPRVRQYQQQQYPQQQHSQRGGEQRQGKSQHQESQGKPEREHAEYRQ